MSAIADDFAKRLQTACGVPRTRVSLIDLEATERAKQARDQVGLVYQNPDLSAIQHPTSDQIRAELGWTDQPIAVTELAVWNYQWFDSVKAAVDGLMASPAHRPWLVNTAYTHWGIGVHEELAPKSLWPTAWQSNEYLETRRYYIVWLATGLPKPKPVNLPTGAEPLQYGLVNPPSTGWVTVGPLGPVNVRFTPTLGASSVDFSTGTVGGYRAILLGDVTGEAWFGNTRWSALWIPERGGFRYCHVTLRSVAEPAR